MYSAESRLKQLLITLDQIANFSKSGDIVFINSAEWEEALATASGFQENNSITWPPLDALLIPDLYRTN